MTPRPPPLLAPARERSRVRRGVRRGVLTVLLAVSSLVVVLGAVELALRLMSWDDEFGQGRVGTWQYTIYDPIVGRRNLPGFHDDGLKISFNALGFRGPDMALEKAPGTVRIACLGDSTTLGIWMEAPGALRADAPYPAELERLLRADGVPVEVINAGVLGATSSEGLAAMLARVLPLEPDVVTVRFGNNDHGRRLRGDITVMATTAEYVALRVLPTWMLSLRATRLVFHGYRQSVARSRSEPAPQRVPPAEYERNLRRFVAVVEAHGARVVFLDFPYREIERGLSPGETFPNPMQAVTSLAELHAVHDEYQAVMRRVASETGVPVVETLHSLRTAPVPTFSDYDLSHPNAVGYGVIARRLHEDLRRLGYLSPDVNSPPS